MDKRIIRDWMKLFGALIFLWLYVPHLMLFIIDVGEDNRADIQRIKAQIHVRLTDMLAFVYLIHNNRYYRSLFYYRIGPIWALLIGWWRPGDRYFQISYTTKIGKGVLIAHPYSTVINAENR